MSAKAISGISLATFAAVAALAVNVDKLSAYWPVTQARIVPLEQRVACLACIQTCTETCARNGIQPGDCDCSHCDPTCSQ